MPRPIKETPILYDEDAYRFEIAAHNVIPLPIDEQEEMWANYNELRQKCALGVYLFDLSHTFLTNFIDNQYITI